ncbi:MAG: hypothetical protein WCL61_01300, partial [bacterium]
MAKVEKRNKKSVQPLGRAFFHLGVLVVALVLIFNFVVFKVMPVKAGANCPSATSRLPSGIYNPFDIGAYGYCTVGTNMLAPVNVFVEAFGFNKDIINTS